MSNDRLYQIALSKIPGIGAKLGKTLVAYCGGVEAVFSESKRLLLRIPGIGEQMASTIVKAHPLNLASDDLQFYNKHNIKINFCLASDYPSRLKHYDDAPLLFYSKGSFNPNPNRAVAIVGTRQPTSYGRQICEQLVEELEVYKVQLISGLAYGVDALAHKTANKFSIENIAVMGTGLDVIYPSANKKLSQDVIKNGALISEYPIRMRADKENFPRRNRVIASMADAIIVVQSAKKGGSLITAEFANQYFKDVFAFPGRINDDMSAGCNALIKQNKAHLIESVNDLAYIMSWETETDKTDNRQVKLFEQLSEEEKRILTFVKQKDDVEIDWLHNCSKVPLSSLSSILLNLEFKGFVKSLPGKRYSSY